MQENINNKKEAKKKADTSGRKDDKERAKTAIKEAKRAVAQAKAGVLNEFTKNWKQ